MQVIYGRNNPLRVRHISYRVEFQGRGAGHIHGVLWLDLNQIEIKGVPKEVLASAFEKLRYSRALEEEENTTSQRSVRGNNDHIDVSTTQVNTYYPSVPVPPPLYSYPRRRTAHFKHSFFLPLSYFKVNLPKAPSMFSTF